MYCDEWLLLSASGRCALGTSPVMVSVLHGDLFGWKLKQRRNQKKGGISSDAHQATERGAGREPINHHSEIKVTAAAGGVPACGLKMIRFLVRGQNWQW